MDQRAQTFLASLDAAYRKHRSPEPVYCLDCCVPRDPFDRKEFDWRVLLDVRLHEAGITAEEFARAFLAHKSARNPNAETVDLDALVKEWTGRMSRAERYKIPRAARLGGCILRHHMVEILELL